jgi:DNA-binding transcriptional regulator WhiA
MVMRKIRTTSMTKKMLRKHINSATNLKVKNIKVLKKATKKKSGKYSVTVIDDEKGFFEKAGTFR